MASPDNSSATLHEARSREVDGEKIDGLVTPSVPGGQGGAGVVYSEVSDVVRVEAGFPNAPGPGPVLV